jgi:hypothetical protein
VAGVATGPQTSEQEMKLEYTTTIALFKALSDVMRLLRQVSIALTKDHGSRLRDVTLRATPAVTSVPPSAFSFFLDAELPEATKTGQVWLGLTIDINVKNDETYVAEGAIGWHRQDAVGTAVACPWDHLECPEWETSRVTEFFDGLPKYAKELIARYEQALREYLRS